MGERRWCPFSRDLHDPGWVSGGDLMLLLNGTAGEEKAVDLSSKMGVERGAR
jgi:hypothetical protein